MNFINSVQLPVCTIFEFGVENEFGDVVGLRLHLLRQVRGHFVGQREDQLRTHSFHHVVLQNSQGSVLERKKEKRTCRSLDGKAEHRGGFDGDDVFGRFVRVQHLLLQHEPHLLPRPVHQSLQPAFDCALGIHGGHLQIKLKLDKELKIV